MKIGVLPENPAAVALNGEGGQKERPRERNSPVGVQMRPLVHEVAPPHKTGPQSEPGPVFHLSARLCSYTHQQSTRLLVRA